jgi:hypothetical protein
MADAKNDSEEDESKEEMMDRIEASRKKDIRASDSDMSDSEGESDFAIRGIGGIGAPADGKGPQLSMIDMLKKGLRDAGTAFSRAFVDYGPPYKIHKDGLALEPCPVVDCLAEMNMSYVKLHRLLNDHMDPNIPDKEDMYNTGMHYAGRYLHYLAARMMLRAGAKINVVNELGQTPLILCIMNVVAHEHDPRKNTQIKMMDWLIDQGANVRHRDKGGYEALDFACMNNNLGIIQRLMECGATLRRENVDLRAKRTKVLEWISDPDVYKFVLDEFNKEEQKFQEKDTSRRKQLAEEAHDKEVQRNLSTLAKRKLEKQKKQQDAMAYERKLVKEANRKKNIESAMNSLTKGKKLKDQEHGEWKADEQRNWHWESRSAVRGADEISKRIHNEAVHKMQTLHKGNRKKIYDARWQAMGGEGTIEAPWTRDTEFFMEGVTDNYSDDEEVVDEIDELGERDENDDLLDGESLDDAMELLSMGSGNPHK